MPVLSVKERTEQQASSYRDGKTTHTRVYLVECSTITDGPAVALSADGVPGPGSYYKGVPFSGKDARRVPKSIRHHEVSVEYAGAGEPEQDDVHPLDRPPEASFGADSLVESYFLDRSDPPKPVVNSAGESPDQFFERERGELVITFVRNVDYWDALAMEVYGNTVNADTVVIDNTSVYPPNTLKLNPPTASRQVETVRIGGVPQEVVYYRATFVLKYRSGGWNEAMVDVGYNELVTKTEIVGGQPKLVKYLQPIFDRAVGTLRKPWPLDGNGRKKPNPGDTPATLEFKPYTMRSWAALYF